MNYTFFHKGDDNIIIISTPRNTTKYKNMVSNPNVSILIHDWISVKGNADTLQDESLSRRRSNSLFKLLANFNKNELSRVSVMLDGQARILDGTKDCANSDFYKSLHLNNPKIDHNQVKNYIECDDNALIVIDVTGCKVTDTDNNVEQY